MDLTYDIKRSWAVVSKGCDGKAVALRPMESYHFDTAYFVALEQGQAPDAGQHCNALTFYFRVNQSQGAQTANGKTTVVNDEATLIPQARRNVCKVGDASKSVELPLESQAELHMSLRATASRPGVQINLLGHPDCLQGTLELFLE
jgi:hypothetical protein